SRSSTALRTTPSKPPIFSSSNPRRKAKVMTEFEPPVYSKKPVVVQAMRITRDTLWDIVFWSMSRATIEPLSGLDRPHITLTSFSNGVEVRGTAGDYVVKTDGV